MNKNKMLKTILPLLIIALFVSLLFTGCGGKTEEEFFTEEKVTTGANIIIYFFFSSIR